MSTERYEQNFGTCALGDQRLSRRALSIGQALSEKFGAGLSSVFESAKELKRAYAFSPMGKPALKRLSNLMVR
ncbi:MAG: transposase DNA-binding-containing protein [Cyanobacteria bacterium P01_A01_bin.37]